MNGIEYLLIPKNNQTNGLLIESVSSGKSLSEALILASTNPQYDKGLFIESPLQ